MNSKCRSNLLSGILSMLSLVAILTGCGKEDNQPIQLHYGIHNDASNSVKGNLVTIFFPASGETQLTVTGGDGDFVIGNPDKTILEVGISDKLIRITPLSIGNTVVTVTDKSGNSYTLNVKVCYKETALVIDKQDVIVIGDKLSEVQKAEIRQKAILTLPVKVNGGFRLVYNEGDKVNKGQAFIYKDSYGGTAVESAFELKRVEIEANGLVQNYYVYVITVDGVQRDFMVNRYVAPVSKSDMKVPMALNEVLTGQFKTDYPDVEFVYTQQRIK